MATKYDLRKVLKRNSEKLFRMVYSDASYDEKLKQYKKVKKLLKAYCELTKDNRNERDEVYISNTEESLFTFEEVVR